MAMAPTLSVFQDDSEEEEEDDDNDSYAVATEVGEEEEDEESEDADTAPSPYYTFASNANDETSSEEDNDNEIEHSCDENEEEDGSQEDSVDDDASAQSPDWNAPSHHKHPFMSQRHTKDVRHRGSMQGSLDSSEIYSTFRDGSDANEERGDNGGGRAASGGYGVFGGSDSSEDEIPF